jgi:hypothetical protein
MIVRVPYGSNKYLSTTLPPVLGPRKRVITECHSLKLKHRFFPKKVGEFGNLAGV